MQLFRFDAAVARPITQFSSASVAIAPIARPESSDSQLVAMHFTAGGHLGRHPARGAQLFLVVAGAGWVAGADGARMAIGAGMAALWEPDEAHESGSDQGMTAIVLEAESLDPAALMPEAARP